MIRFAGPDVHGLEAVPMAGNMEHPQSEIKVAV